MAMVTYKLTQPIFTKFLNFNKFVKNLDLCLFLTNKNRLPCKCNNCHFADRHKKDIVKSDRRIIRDNALKKLFIKGPKYREGRHMNLEKAKSYTLGLHNCFLSWCDKNGLDKSFFLEWIDNVNPKTAEGGSICSPPPPPPPPPHTLCGSVAFLKMYLLKTG